MQHDYIEFCKESAMHPLPVQPTVTASSTVVLAKTMKILQKSSATRVELDTIFPLSEMLSGQSTEAYKAFIKHRIGYYRSQLFRHPVLV